MQAGVGRFTQEDPLPLFDGPNLFAYVTNGPLDQVDPSGLLTKTGCLAACVGDALLNFGGGFIPGYRLVAFIAEHSGVNINLFQAAFGVDEALSSSPTKVAAAVGSGAYLYAETDFAVQGGEQALERAEDLAARQSVLKKTAQQQEKLITKLFKLRKAGKIVGVLGGLSNLLNLVDFLHELKECWTKCEGCPK